MTSFERNTIAEIKARLAAGQPIAAWEKQMVLDLLRREGGVMSRVSKALAANEGFNVDGIKTA
jgi:hypothetical protein